MGIRSLWSGCLVQLTPCSMPPEKVLKTITVGLLAWAINRWCGQPWPLSWHPIHIYTPLEGWETHSTHFNPYFIIWVRFAEPLVQCLVFLHLAALVGELGWSSSCYSWFLLTLSQPRACGIIEQLLVIVTGFDHLVVRGSCAFPMGESQKATLLDCS